MSSMSVYVTSRPPHPAHSQSEGETRVVRRTDRSSHWRISPVILSDRVVHSPLLHSHWPRLCSDRLRSWCLLPLAGSLWHKRAGVSNTSDLISDFEWTSLVKWWFWSLISVMMMMMLVWSQGSGLALLWTSLRSTPPAPQHHPTTINIIYNIYPEWSTLIGRDCRDRALIGRRLFSNEIFSNIIKSPLHAPRWFFMA